MDVCRCLYMSVNSVYICTCMYMSVDVLSVWRGRNGFLDVHVLFSDSFHFSLIVTLNSTEVAIIVIKHNSHLHNCSLWQTQIKLASLVRLWRHFELSESIKEVNLPDSFKMATIFYNINRILVIFYLTIIKVSLQTHI